MDKFEIDLNKEVVNRRQKRKPSTKKHKITLVTVYCKGCGLCVDVCPTGTLQLEDNHDSKFGVSAKAVAEDYCIGCQMCESRCPDFAIFVDPENKTNHD